MANGQTKKLISVVTSAYNEEASVEELAKQLQKVFDENYKYDFEAIIVENGSADSTYEKLLEIHKRDKRFKILQTSRTFYCEGGLTAGLNFASGDAAAIIAADLQEPPSMITKFIEKWEEGYENVYGVVTKRKDISWIRSINSKLFYWVINRMTDRLFPPNVSDFRLVDKKVYQAINTMHEQSRFVRGMFAWAGFKSIGIPFERASRFAGESKSSFSAVIELALKAIFIYSRSPLRFITFLGIFVSVGSFLFLVYTIANVFIRGVPFAGYGTLMSVITFMFGILFLILGVISEYIALIFDETKQRPNFIIRNKVGFNDNDKI